VDLKGSEVFACLLDAKVRMGRPASWQDASIAAWHQMWRSVLSALESLDHQFSDPVKKVTHGHVGFRYRFLLLKCDANLVEVGANGCFAIDHTISHLLVRMNLGVFGVSSTAAS
jgi:hypothetical protein